MDLPVGSWCRHRGMAMVIPITATGEAITAARSIIAVRVMDDRPTDPMWGDAMAGPGTGTPVIPTDQGPA